MFSTFLLAVALAACATDNVGSTDQAIGQTLTIAGEFNYDAKHPAFAQLDADEMFLAGGFNGGGASDKLRMVIFDNDTKTATYSKFMNGNSEVKLIHARGDAQMVQVATLVFAVFGGKTSESSNTQLDSIEIVNLNNNPATVVEVTQTLASGRSNFGLTECGTNKWLISGGIDENGDAVASLEVFTYISSSNGVNSTVSTMKSADNGTSVIELSNPRAFHAALKLPAILGGTAGRIQFVAGQDPSSGVLASTETADINSSCQLVDNDAGNTKLVPHTGPSLPGARTHFAALARNVVVTVAGIQTTHEAILAGGDNGSSASPITYVYDDQATPGSAVWRAGPTLASAHVRPTLALRPDNGDFTLVGGVSGMLGSSNTTVEADLFTDANDAFTNPFDLLTGGRIGAWAGYLDGQWIAGHGVKIVSGTETYLRTVE